MEGRPRPLIGTLGGGFFGFAYGFVAGVVKAYSWQAALPTCLRIGLVDGLVFGVVFSAGAGLTFCLLGVLESPLDLDSVVSPRSLLNTNRATVTTQLLVWAPTFGQWSVSAAVWWSTSCRGPWARSSGPPTPASCSASSAASAAPSDTPSP
ncbi:hypothetical protein WKI71_17010 [Streptomyces sp. MS1.AVA.1]|uniref:Uncharacterized protein n=1 Tax=Streptomyces machairae TaxID=3134109 RepID=A0ABU8UKX8_9ACTN